MTLTQKRLLVGSAAALALLVAFAWGRFSAPGPRVETRVETVVDVQEKERIVEKVVTVVQREEAKRVVINREVIVYRDGSSKTTEQEVTQEAAREQAQVSSEKQQDREQQVSLTQAAVTVSDPYGARWALGAGVELDLGDPDPELRVEASVRVAGPIWLRAAGSTGGTVSVSAAVEF